MAGLLPLQVYPITLTVISEEREEQVSQLTIRLDLRLLLFFFVHVSEYECVVHKTLTFENFCYNH